MNPRRSYDVMTAARESLVKAQSVANERATRRAHIKARIAKELEALWVHTPAPRRRFFLFGRKRCPACSSPIFTSEFTEIGNYNNHFKYELCDCGYERGRSTITTDSGID